MNFTVFFLFLLLSYSMADSGPKEVAGFDAAADVITEDTIAGSWLIYDCQEQHWTCVIKADFDECAELRKKDKIKRIKRLRCAPIGEFPTKKSCFQRQLYMVGQSHGSRVCVNDRWKQRMLD